jgi:hypothetical protein
MENQNNPTRPWLDQDVMAVPGPQHPLPKHPEKWLPKFDLDSKQSVEDHIKKFMLDVRLQSVEHRHVVCRLFPYTFEGNASTCYFAQQPQTIVSWDKFETCFLEKFRDDKYLEVLVMELSSLKMKPKEKVKDFNQRFPSLKNKISVDSMPTENLTVAYYTKALHNNIAIWVKRCKNNTLLESFEEAVLIEKDIMSLKDNLSSEAETTSSSKKKIEILTRPPQAKNQQETSDLESLQKSFQKLSNQVIELKRSTEEASTSKGSFIPPFIKPFSPNRPNPTTEGIHFEGLQYSLQTILEAHDNFVSAPPENHDEEGEEETPDEEESSPPIFGHLSDNIFQANFETVHPYNTRSKTQNKPLPETSKNVVSKQPKQTKTRQKFVATVLEYDLVEDLKKLMANISVFELLKFPLILKKMLQIIAENNKKNDLISKKSTETTQKKIKMSQVKSHLKIGIKGTHRKNCRKLR